MTPIIGIQIIGAALFQALGKALPSLVLTLLRQVILLTPLILILPRIMDNQLLGVWMSFPIADLLSTLVTAAILRKEMSNFFIEDNDKIQLDY